MPCIGSRYAPILVLLYSTAVMGCNNQPSDVVGSARDAATIPHDADNHTMSDGAPDPAASWPMPDSTPYCVDGLMRPTACPTRGEPTDGQDGDYVINPMGYDTTGEVARDQRTGLFWQRHASPALLTWPEAQAYCAGLALDDRSGWRLPTRMELVSLLDLGRSQPAIDSATFPSTIQPFGCGYALSSCGTYWSKTAPFGFPGSAIVVGFGSGDGWAYFPRGTSHWLVRCVHDPDVARPAAPQYAVGPNTVKDLYTGLEWQRGVSAISFRWLTVFGYCAHLILDGKADWRVPSAKELYTLIREDAQPAIDRTAFPDSENRLWSSTPLVAGSSPPARFAFTVDLRYGVVATDCANDGDCDPWYPVRCVRGGAVP